MPNAPAIQDQDVFSDRKLMLAVGVTALFLPIAVWVVNRLRCESAGYPATSVSQYYFSGAHAVFVGALCFVGGLLLVYQGWRREERGRTQQFLSKAAGLCALVVGLVPASLDAEPVRVFKGDMLCNVFVKYLDPIRLTPFPPAWEPVVHYICASALFLWLAWTAGMRFTEPSNDPTELAHQTVKATRNFVYKFCGVSMALGMAICLAVALLAYLKIADLTQGWAIFFGEALALMAFGFAWLTKSRWILGYPGQTYGILKLNRP
jgi:hypothetical protein